MTRGTNRDYDTTHERTFVRAFLMKPYIDRCIALLNRPGRRHDLMNSIFAPLREDRCSIVSSGQLLSTLKRALPDVESRSGYVIARYYKIDRTTRPVSSIIDPVDDFDLSWAFDSCILSIIPGALAVVVNGPEWKWETWVCVNHQELSNDR